MTKALAPLVCLLFACGVEAPANESNPAFSMQASAVVGGKAESRFPAVGYFAEGASTLTRYPCGATLIAPRVAVTAAHCIALSKYTRFGMGFGAAGSNTHSARASFVHTGYRSTAADRAQHDVAVLQLDDTIRDITPAKIRATAVNAKGLFVGYGRVTEGDYDQAAGYTHERKSASVTTTKTGATNFSTTGIDGGLCWGDSGGPVLDEATGELLGVLSDFDEVFYCKVGNKMIFTSLDAERAFLDRAIACGDASDFAACMK